MNEFQQDYENEKRKFDNPKYFGRGLFISKVEYLFDVANLLRSRYELELQRGAITEEYLELLKIAARLITK